MDPHWLFPVLAAGFGIAAAVHWRRHGRVQAAGRTWWLLALAFGGVALWLSLAH